jgi:hypothetical protein
MKANERSLERLIAAGAKASPEPTGIPPFGLETRVLANWRAAQVVEEPAFLFVFLRRAMIAASFVLVLSAAWSFTRPGIGPAGEEADQLDYQIQMSLNP